MSSLENMLQIGEVAERVGLSLRTVRYYEEMELLAPAGRTEGGFRLYTEGEVERLDLIKQMKPLGFSVQEMRDLLAARDALRDAGVDEAAAERARERLKEFASAAADSCEQLRVQLDQAEDFAKRLRRETRRASPTPVRS
ncbi:MAG: MerR family transcriptional regulator [Thermoleophilaceae bacterium]